MAKLLSEDDFFEIFRNEAQTRDSRLTDFSEGSSNNAMAGIAAVAARELQRLSIIQFNKTFFATAHGPEITGGPDDLQTLALDHFGDNFARPDAENAVGDVTFSRANTSEGDVVIPKGTIVKTEQDANGEEQRFKTTSEVKMTGTSIQASVEAIEAGTAGNVNAGTVIVIESALTDDSVEVTNASAFSGGEEASDDAEYREFLRNRIEVIRGATKAAIKAAAVEVPGIVIATVVEKLLPVIEWDIGSSSTVGAFFRIPYVTLYVADINGQASSALLTLVEDAILPVRAAGVQINVLGASPQTLNWSASITLNPSGPNFGTLNTDTSLITDSMSEYIKNLDIGDDFSRPLANQAILDIWGPSGTNDITAFTTSNPSGNIATSATTKLVPGTMEIV